MNGECGQLVNLARDGDREAFGEIYRAERDVIYRYIGCRVGCAAVAEDLTSETFLRALRGISAFHWQGYGVRTWLMAIARNLIIDYYRAQARVGESAEPAVETSPDPHEVLWRELQLAKLRAALDRIPVEQRDCLRLRFFADCSIAETARQLGKTTGAVKALQNRGIRSLGREFNRPGSRLRIIPQRVA